MKRILSLTAAAFMMVAAPALAGDTPAPEGAAIYLINLADGETVSAPVKINFGFSGMGVAPAGPEKEKTGHHHLLIDRPPLGEGADGAEELTYGIPADDHHKHFGGGQTEV